MHPRRVGGRSYRYTGTVPYMDGRGEKAAGAAEQQLAAVKGWVAQVIKGCKVPLDAARKM